MKAAVYRRTGGPEVLSVEEIETPEPGPGQVRVRVELSGVNPTDWKSRSGATGADPEGFQVPHHDGAGVVDALGEGAGGTGGLAVGQRVWTYLAGAGNRYGTAAEYSVLAQDRVVPLPDGASFELGASLGVPALTAAHCLGADPGALVGRCVLVAGGAGAVGHYAIELAKFAGARVVATVSNEEKAELARKAGADRVVNYRKPGAADRIADFGRPDRIVEVAFGANLELDVAVSHPGTHVVVYASEASDPVLPTRKLMGANITVSWALLYGIGDEEKRDAVRWTSEALAAGALTTLPLHVYPLEQVAEAQKAVEGGAVGKVLVRPVGV